MRIISWNCRGLGKSEAVTALRKLNNVYRPDFMFLCERKRTKTDPGSPFASDCRLANVAESDHKQPVRVSSLTGCLLFEALIEFAIRPFLQQPDMRKSSLLQDGVFMFPTEGHIHMEACKRKPLISIGFSRLLHGHLF